MDNVKNDRYYTSKIMVDLSFIQNNMSGLSFEEFQENELLQDSMMFRLIQISENARKLTALFREKLADVPWGDVFGLRNRIVHEYGGLVLKIVYDTLIIDIPDLAAKLSACSSE